MSALPTGLTKHRVDGGLAFACRRSRLPVPRCRLSGHAAAPGKNLGSSDAQHPEPRGQTVPDSGKFWATQRVPPQVGSIRVVMRLNTWATCTSNTAYSSKACTGDTPRNARLKAVQLTDDGQRLALPGGAAM